MIELFARAIDPLFRRLFPAVPRGHPAGGSIVMNFSANMLGLDNAATPLGLKAMRELQEINPHKDVASNPMIMFLVLNTAGITLIPTSVIAIRQSDGDRAGPGRLQRRRHLPAHADRHLHQLRRRPGGRGLGAAHPAAAGPIVAFFGGFAALMACACTWAARPAAGAAWRRPSGWSAAA
jgi:hypothetical protein